ncbi:MAG TPA: hypothetical protein VFD46_11305 [Chryseolinea sp.]|nr:hypothetical protein [Chryseolinea sp.]
MEQEQDEKLPSIKKLQAEIDAMKPKFTMPTLNDLHADQIEVAGRIEALNGILNHQVPKEWIKEHPFIKGWKYLPIDKTEYLLRKIFKKVAVEILREGVAFNGVFVVVRVHYLNPATGEMLYHDGIGACQLQTKQGTSPADLMNINNGAISMAFPIAKSLAVKDACDHFGNLFGANLNRKDITPFQVDGKLMEDYTVNRYDRAMEEN